MSTLSRLAGRAFRGGWSEPIDPLLRAASLRMAGLLRSSIAPVLSGDDDAVRAAAEALDACYGNGMPLILGHRGAMARAPENTLGAFEAAIADGAHGVELDTTLSGDSVPVVIHDDTLDRTTNVTGKPTDFDADELGALDAAADFPGWHRREKVPRLDEVFRAMPDGAVVNVELKGPSAPWVGLEREVIDVVMRHTPRVSVIISSFHPAQLLEVRRRAPQLPVAVLLWPESVLPLRTGLAVPLLGANAVHPPSSMVDARFMDAAKAAGLRVNVWRVRDDDDAARLMNLGVDGLIVDDVRATVAVARHR